MKKSILFGALAFFAVSAMSIENANAQTPVKVKKAETTEVSKKSQAPSATTVKQEPVKKTDDCCADKKVSADKKACADKKNADCCADKKVSADKKFSTDKKVKAETKRVKKADMKVRKEAKKVEKKVEKADNAVKVEK